MEATPPIDRLKTKVLECSTATEQALHVTIWEADDNELEVLQSWWNKSERVIKGGEGMAVTQLGDAQRGREAERGRWQRAHKPIIKSELLELI